MATKPTVRKVDGNGGKSTANPNVSFGKKQVTQVKQGLSNAEERRRQERELLKSL